MKYHSTPFNPSKKAKIVLLSLAVIFALVIIISVIALIIPKNPSTHIHIDNFSEITSAPDEYRKLIEDTIWNTIQNHSEITQKDLSNATIRKGSSSEDTDGNLVTTSFLVDLESLHYTFRVTFFWNNSQKKVPSDPTISVTCPSADEIIYDDFVCPIDASLAIRNHLPHEETLKDGTQINLTLKRYDTYQNHAGESYLAISLPTCNSYNQLLEAKNLTEKWLGSLHLDASNLRLEISCTNCPLNSNPTGTDYCHLYSDSTENSTLFSVLPYADANFKVEPIDPSTNRIRIIIFIDRSSSDYPSHTDEARSRYLNEALSWIKSHGFNPSDYPYETTTEYL